MSDGDYDAQADSIGSYYAAIEAKRLRGDSNCWERPLRRVQVSDQGRYKSARGARPVLDWLAIDQLVIDGAYQRDLKPGNWKSIRAIAERFSWQMFSPVFVSPIGDARFAIIDGQHRVHAAALCGEPEVPCQIVTMTRSEQAAAFAAVNGQVTAVTHWQIYKAALAAGEAWALGIDRLARDAGCRVMTSNASMMEKKPGEIYAVVALRRLAEIRPPALITAALKILMVTDGYRDAPEIWANTILFPLLAAMTERPPALAAPGFSDALAGFDLWGVLDRIDERIKTARRNAMPVEAKKVTLQAAIVLWIDKTFPARMALPAPMRPE